MTLATIWWKLNWTSFNSNFFGLAFNYSLRHQQYQQWYKLSWLSILLIKISKGEGNEQWVATWHGTKLGALSALAYYGRLLSRGPIHWWPFLCCVPRVSIFANGLPVQRLTFTLASFSLFLIRCSTLSSGRWSLKGHDEYKSIVRRISGCNQLIQSN